MDPASTVTSTGPAAWAGLVAVSCVSDTTCRADPATPPNRTAVAPVKPVPVSVTPVPPAALPLLGETPVTVGVEKRKLSPATMGLVPYSVVTRTSVVMFDRLG